MTDTTSPLAPLPVVVGLLPSTTSAIASSARRPGLVGARSRTLSFGVGLGLGARRRSLHAPSSAAGYPTRPPSEWHRSPESELVSHETSWSPWQISDRLAAPALRGLASIQNTTGADSRSPRRPTSAATIHRSDRVRVSTSSSPGSLASPAGADPLRSSMSKPPVPAITGSNQIEFVETGHEAGSRDDMLSKLSQLNRLRGGATAPQRASEEVVHSPVPTSVDQGLPIHVRPVADPVQLIPEPRIGVLKQRPGPRSVAASSTEFLNAWESSPAQSWPDTASPISASVMDAPVPAAAAALEALRGSRPAESRIAAPGPVPTPPASSGAIPPGGSPAGVGVAAVAGEMIASPGASNLSGSSMATWPGDMAPVEWPADPVVRRASEQNAGSVSAPRVRAQVTADQQIDFGVTGHEEGSQADMLSKLAQLENLRDPGRPSPRRGPLGSPSDSPGGAPRVAANLAAGLSNSEVRSTTSASGSSGPGDRRSLPSLMTSTNALARAVEPFLGATPTVGQLSSQGLPSGSLKGEATQPKILTSGTRITRMDNRSSASLTAPTIDGATAPPLAVRFLHELRSRQRVETEALPMAFRGLADQIAGSVPVMIATGAASRRALGSVGRVAATVGSTIHLAERPDDSARSQQILAHELTHVAEPSTMPRFFDDPVVNAEEREARRAEHVVRRAIRDGVSPTSAARGRSVGGAVPAVSDQGSAADIASGAGRAEVIRRSAAGALGSGTVSAQSYVDRAQGRPSESVNSPSSSVVQRTVAESGRSTRRDVQRSPAHVPETDSETSTVDSLPSMDEIVREVERRLTKKIIGERVRRGQSFRGKI